MTLKVYDNKDYAAIAPKLYGSGYATLDNELLSPSPAQYLAAADSFADLQARARHLNVHWAYIEEREDAIWAAVDRSSSRPIYYRQTVEGIEMSSNGYDLLRSGDEVDEDAAFFFRYKGFCSGSSTLAKSIKRIPPGHCLCVTNGGEAELSSYFPCGGELLDMSYYDAKEMAKQKLMQAAERFLKLIGSRPMILLLSAGLDSRFVAYALAAAGKTDQVLALTYGRPDDKNPELKKARLVAERLGLKHRFVSSLGAEPVQPYLNDEESLCFIDYLSGLGSSYYYQDYRPAKQLLAEGVLTPETFVLPGHKGDMLGGVDILFHFLHQEVKDEHLAYALLNYEKFNQQPAASDKARLFECFLDLLGGYKDKYAFQRYERFFETEQAPKYTFNSSRAWRYFGAEPALLFDDVELSQFFYNLPFEYRWGKRIYFEALRDLFQEKSVSFADDRDLLRTLSSPSRRIKNLLRPLLDPLLAKRSMWRYDPMGFKQLMAPMPAVVAKDGRFKPATINGLSFAWNYMRAETKIREAR